jgi:kynurenine formamidase
LAIEVAGRQGPAPAAHPELTKQDVEKMMKDISNWGRWGKDDQIGTLNLITPAKRKQAAALVKAGVPVSLSRVEDAAFNDTQRQPNGAEVKDLYPARYHGYTHTHLDALSHLYYQGKMYNDSPQTILTDKGATKLSIVNFKNGIFTRAVLMDMPRLWGVEYLDGRRPIYVEDLEAWEKKAHVRVESGDAVLLRIGRWARQGGTWEFEKGSPGFDVSCMPWFKQRDVALIGSDLVSDVLPSGVKDFWQPVHWVSIISLGMPILDNLDLEALSEAANARKQWSFALAVNPLVVEGGTGSAVNPIAIF